MLSHSHVCKGCGELHKGCDCPSPHEKIVCKWCASKGVMKDGK